ncbi:hypothetical protein [Streptomyces sp. NPDC048584]|uniref:hypothetical protein n=1 Tax=Streptomyces sp. NPDC048584 TaxID=3365573 RepID=UPI0037185D92
MHSPLDEVVRRRQTGRPQRTIAVACGLPPDRVVLGGDHLCDVPRDYGRNSHPNQKEHV